jgi:hypothetical protein
MDSIKNRELNVIIILSAQEQRAYLLCSLGFAHTPLKKTKMQPT